MNGLDVYGNEHGTTAFIELPAGLMWKTIWDFRELLRLSRDIAMAPKDPFGMSSGYKRIYEGKICAGDILVKDDGVHLIIDSESIFCGRKIHDKRTIYRAVVKTSCSDGHNQATTLNGKRSK